MLLKRHQSTFSSVILANISTQEKNDVSLRVSDFFMYMTYMHVFFLVHTFVADPHLLKSMVEGHLHIAQDPTSSLQSTNETSSFKNRT